MVPEIWSTKDIILCNSGQFFALLPLMNPENQISIKMKKAPEDIIIIQMCTINDSHWFPTYGVHQQNFLSFWTVF